MFSIISVALTTLTFSTYFASGASIADRVSQLRLAPTNVQRVNLLEDADVSCELRSSFCSKLIIYRLQFVFDFLHPIDGESDGAGGHTVAATSNNFLAAVENGMGMSMCF